jgi:RimJ/RimL family protein N-acetyltransferase
MPMFNTDRLTLRPLKLEDAKEIFDYRSDAISNQYQGWTPTNIEEVNDFIKNKVSSAIDIPDTWFQFVIIKKDTGRVIGDLGVHFIDEEKNQAELGCTINKQYHGQGFAKEAMAEVIGYLFNHLNKHRISASVDPRNIGSVKLMESLEFRKEAHFRESLYLNGEWVDDVIYGLLQSEWDRNN